MKYEVDDFNFLCTNGLMVYEKRKRKKKSKFPNWFSYAWKSKSRQVSEKEKASLYMLSIIQPFLSLSFTATHTHNGKTNQ